MVVHRGHRGEFGIHLSDQWLITAGVVNGIRHFMLTIRFGVRGIRIILIGVAVITIRGMFLIIIRCMFRAHRHQIHRAHGVQQGQQ